MSDREDVVRISNQAKNAEKTRRKHHGNTKLLGCFYPSIASNADLPNLHQRLATKIRNYLKIVNEHAVCAGRNFGGRAMSGVNPGEAWRCRR